MKLRKFEFKKIEIIERNGDAEVKRGILDYRQTAKDIITSPTPNAQGLSTEELIKAVMVYGKIKEAFDKGADHALLDNEAFQFFSTRIKDFRWAFAAPEIVDFIQYVRGLPEVEVELAPAAEASKA